MPWTSQTTTSRRRGQQSGCRHSVDRTALRRWHAGCARRAMSDLRSAQRVHLVGIGGAGMGALATLLLELHKQVSGSDAQHSAVLERLAAAGARVSAGHARENLGDAEYVVRSSAVPVDNPELMA